MRVFCSVRVIKLLKVEKKWARTNGISAQKTEYMCYVDTYIYYFWYLLKANRSNTYP